jgi:hypothetical protein
VLAVSQQQFCSTEQEQQQGRWNQQQQQHQHTPWPLPCFLQVNQSQSCHGQQPQQQQPGKLPLLSPLAWHLPGQHCTALHYSTHAKQQQQRQQRQTSRPTKHAADKDNTQPLPSSIDWTASLTTHLEQQQQQHPDKQQQQQHPDKQQQQQQQHRSAVSRLHQQQQIPEGELMSLINAAGSITDIERLVLRYHTQFK